MIKKLYKIKASLDKIKSHDDITDEIYRKYGIAALIGTDAQVYDINEFDDIIPSAFEAVRLAQAGHDFMKSQDPFDCSADYFAFSKRNGALVSISKKYLLSYLKENLEDYELFDWLKENEYI